MVTIWASPNNNKKQHWRIELWNHIFKLNYIFLYERMILNSLWLKKILITMESKPIQVNVASETLCFISNLLILWDVLFYFQSRTCWIKICSEILLCKPDNFNRNRNPRAEIKVILHLHSNSISHKHPSFIMMSALNMILVL